MVRIGKCAALLLVLAGLVAGCDSFSVEKIATPAGDRRAQRVLRALVDGEQDSLLAHARLGGDSIASAKGLAQLDSLMRGRGLDSLQLIGANRFSTGDVERLTLTYEMRTERGWLAATVTTIDSAGSWALLGVHAETLPGELRHLHEFTLGNRGPSRYLVLLGVIACTIFTIATAVFIATRRRFPRRWRWVFASLVGTGAVYVDWTTGAVASRLVTVQLFAASALRPNEFAPWVLSFSFPVGALLALSRYRRWREQSTLAMPGVPPADALPPAEAAT